jgi:hypothetical protein
LTEQRCWKHLEEHSKREPQGKREEQSRERAETGFKLQPLLSSRHEPAGNAVGSESRSAVTDQRKNSDNYSQYLIKDAEHDISIASHLAVMESSDTISPTSTAL